MVEFLTQAIWEDGKPRVPGTIVLFAEEGSFKACLCDKDSDSVGFVTSPVASALLSAVEGALSADQVDWRRNKARGDRLGSRSRG